MKLQILSALTILMFLAPVTQAATCATTDVTAEGIGAYACKTHTISNNDNGYAADINSDFGLSGSIVWGDPIKSDAPNTPLSYESETQTWTLTNTLVSAPFVVVIKANNDFASYLFTLPEVADSGTFSLIFYHLVGNGKNNDNVRKEYYDLSHISIYTTTKGPGPGFDIFGERIPAVPLPAALWLFGPALLGFIGFRRKNKS